MNKDHLYNTIEQFRGISPVLTKLLSKGVYKTFKEETYDDVSNRTRLAVDKNGRLTISVNEQWWDNVSQVDREFRLLNDALSLAANHSGRAKHKKIAKLVSELVNSEYSFKYFGFDKDRVQSHGLKTTDNQPEWLSDSEYDSELLFESVESYVKSLDEDDEGDDGKQDDDSDDSDSDSDSDSGDSFGGQDDIDQEGLEKLLESVSKQSSDDEIKELIEESDLDDYDEASKSSKAGTEPSTMKKHYGRLTPPKKRKWETIVHVVAGRALNTNSVSAWDRNPAALQHMLSSLNARLPRVHEEEMKTWDKPVMMLFADTSGSCVQYWDRFAKAAMSIDFDKIDVRLYAFDTRVYSVDRNDLTMPGGGGTYFHIIGAEVDSVVKEMGVHPHVVVITDGEGNDPKVQPGKELLWSWLMVGSKYDKLIPKNCKIYDLDLFE